MLLKLKHSSKKNTILYLDRCRVVNVDNSNNKYKPKQKEYKIDTKIYHSRSLERKYEFKNKQSQKEEHILPKNNELHYVTSFKPMEYFLKKQNNKFLIDSTMSSKADILAARNNSRLNARAEAKLDQVYF